MRNVFLDKKSKTGTLFPRGVLFLLFILLFSMSGSALLWSDPGFFADSPREDLVFQIVESMDDTELLGQVFLLGYYGRRPSREIIEWIRDKKIGGVKIFGWNAEDLRELAQSIGEMQKAAASTRLEIPLFVATDQEGGWVRHVKGETSVTPGNLAIGATGLPYDAYYTGFYIGEELRVLGINMNFAPTVDVYVNEHAHVIGPRAFSDDPVVTSNLALAYYRGLQKAGIISTAKHFPGHGNADEDSHGTLPVIHTDFQSLWERDLLPYRFLIKNELPAIMSAHLSFPEILGEAVPASLSSYFLKDVVRNRLGFEGIVITDDMRMHGVLQNGTTISDACLKALKAGNDMIMVSPDPAIHQRIWDKLFRELRDDPSFRRSLEESVRRIIRIKLDYLRNKDGVPLFPDPEKVHSDIPAAEGREFFFDQACRSVSVVSPGRIPYAGEGEKVLLAGQLHTFLRIGKEYYPDADTYYFPYTPFYNSEEVYVRELSELAKSHDTLIYCLANPNSAEVLQSLEESPAEVLVISVLTPVYLRALPWVKTSLAVYGTGEDSFIAGFAALSGKIPAIGELPLALYPPVEQPTVETLPGRE